MENGQELSNWCDYKQSHYWQTIGELLDNLVFYENVEYPKEIRDILLRIPYENLQIQVHETTSRDPDLYAIMEKQIQGIVNPEPCTFIAWRACWNDKCPTHLREKRANRHFLGYSTNWDRIYQRVTPERKGRPQCPLHLLWQSVLSKPALWEWNPIW